MAIPTISDVVRSSTSAFSGGYAGERVISGTTDTPTTADKDFLLRTTSSSATTITLTGSGWTQGQSATIVQDGTGAVTLVPGSSNTLLPSITIKLRAQGSAVVIFYLGSNRWMVVGDILGFGEAIVSVLASDVTNNNATANTIADVTGLSFPVLSGKRYEFKFFVRYTAAAATTGSRWSISGPATPTELCYRSNYTLTATSETVNSGLTAYDTPAASSASSLTTGNIAIVEGIIVPSADGTVTLRFASEILSSAIVAKAGSYVEYRQLS